MTLAETILHRVQGMPESLQVEVLDFVAFLESQADAREQTQEESNWSRFSLSAAMRGMQDEQSAYSSSDISA